jgi:hypothetical protein
MGLHFNVYFPNDVKVLTESPDENHTKPGTKYERERRELSGWRLDARLMTLLCEQIIVAKHKKVKRG